MSDTPETDERELRWLIEDHNLFDCDGYGCGNERCVWCTDVVERILAEKESDDSAEI